jgi:hypothetical protein
MKGKDTLVWKCEYSHEHPKWKSLGAPMKGVETPYD